MQGFGFIEVSASGSRDVFVQGFGLIELSASGVFLRVCASVWIHRGVRQGLWSCAWARTLLAAYLS